MMDSYGTMLQIITRFVDDNGKQFPLFSKQDGWKVECEYKLSDETPYDSEAFYKEYVMEYEIKLDDKLMRKGIVRNTNPRFTIYQMFLDVCKSVQ